MLSALEKLESSGSPEKAEVTAAKEEAFGRASHFLFLEKGVEDLFSQPLSFSSTDFATLAKPPKSSYYNTEQLSAIKSTKRPLNPTAKLTLNMLNPKIYHTRIRYERNLN